MSGTEAVHGGAHPQAVKLTLANVIRDTATPHGMRHPLSDGTIEDLRQCLALISARERELAQAAARGERDSPASPTSPRAGKRWSTSTRRTPRSRGRD